MCDCNSAFHADVVGSLLRPAALKTARQQFLQGEIDALQLREVEDQQIRLAVAKQKDLGLAVVTDGEFRRACCTFAVGVRPSTARFIRI